MDHALLTGWLSVDPMADKYPSISPYAYCAWNSIKLIDPDGMEADNPPTSLVYAIQKGDNFWNLENAWNIPHGTLQRINPSADPHDLKEGQVINAARMEGSLLVVGDNVVIQEEREPDFSYDDGYSGFMLVAPSSDFLTFRMAFDGLCYDLTWAFGGDAKKAGSALRKLSTRNSSWCYGHHHGMRKWNNEFIKRGWTEKQVTRTIEKGKPTAAENRVNPGNKATRYTNRNTGKALTLDRVTRELIQVGASDFEY